MIIPKILNENFNWIDQTILIYCTKPFCMLELPVPLYGNHNKTHFPQYLLDKTYFTVKFHIGFDKKYKLPSNTNEPIFLKVTRKISAGFFKM